MSIKLPYGLVYDNDGQDGGKVLVPDRIQGDLDALALAIPTNTIQYKSNSFRSMQFGTGTWTWAGALAKSNAVVVNHNLGTTPLGVFIINNQTQGAADTLCPESYAYAASTFTSRAQFVAGLVPLLGATATFVWIAVA